MLANGSHHCLTLQTTRNSGTSCAQAGRAGRTPRVLIIEPNRSAGLLYADLLRTHGITDEVVIHATVDEIESRDLENIDAAVCSAAPTRSGRLNPFHGLIDRWRDAHVLVLMPADAPEGALAALHAGAGEVLLRAPGYLEQLPLAVAKLLHRKMISDTEARTAGAADRRTSIAAALKSMRKDNMDLRRLVEQLKGLASTDTLTGLLNRRALDQRLDELMATAMRHRVELSMLMLDLDGFKLVNDILGHAAGDEVLRHAAASIRAVIRRSDVPARYGGDELLVLLPYTCASAAANVAARIQIEFRKRTLPLQVQLAANVRARGVIKVIAAMGGRVQAADPAIDMSIGVACTSLTHIRSSEDLLSAADAAMFRGKAAGKGRIEIADTKNGQQHIAA